MTPIDLSIIIVNWNSARFIEKCIQSIYEGAGNINFEIIVVDNASYDECGNIIRKKFPDVAFVQSTKNLGFARANNLGYQHSKGQILLFLNPDTVIRKNAIQILYNYLKATIDVGVTGAKLLNSDLSIQTSCIRAFPSILNQVLDAEILQKLFPRWRLWGISPLFEKPDSPVHVDAISGACMMIKRSLFEEIKMFSKDYFMYSEDVDLCRKVKEAGSKIYYLPMAEIVHHGGGSSLKTDVSVFSTVMMIESRFQYFKKHYSVSYAIIYRLVMFLLALTRIGILYALWPFYALRGKTLLFKKSLKKWTANLRWAIGLEKWLMDYDIEDDTP